MNALFQADKSHTSFVSWQSIAAAHENMQQGRLYIDETEVLDANINRSPTSYLNNPQAERDL